jgi:hypothetical protein
LYDSQPFSFADAAAGAIDILGYAFPGNSIGHLFQQEILQDWACVPRTVPRHIVQQAILSARTDPLPPSESGAGGIGRTATSEILRTGTGYWILLKFD